MIQINWAIKLAFASKYQMTAADINLSEGQFEYKAIMESILKCKPSHIVLWYSHIPQKVISIIFNLFYFICRVNQAVTPYFLIYFKFKQFNFRVRIQSSTGHCICIYILYSTYFAIL